MTSKPSYMWNGSEWIGVIGLPGEAGPVGPTGPAGPPVATGGIIQTDADARYVQQSTIGNLLTANQAMQLDSPTRTPQASRF
jgi:hypothetical protein